jgi:hypothetical protein
MQCHCQGPGRLEQGALGYEGRSRGSSSSPAWLSPTAFILGKPKHRNTNQSLLSFLLLSILLSITNQSLLSFPLLSILLFPS